MYKYMHQRNFKHLAAFTLTSPYLPSSITNKDMHSKRLYQHLCQCTRLYLTDNSIITFVIKLRYLKPGNSLPRTVTKIIFCQCLFNVDSLIPVFSKIP